MKTKKISRRRIFEIIQIAKVNDTASTIFDCFIIGSILVSIFTTICLTFNELERWGTVLHSIETVTMICFTVELVLRLWTADFLFNCGRIASATKYAISFNGIVEILSIVPFYLPMVFPTGIIVFRMLRVIRVLRLFQANTYSDAMSTILVVLKQKRGQIMSSLFIIFLIMLMSSLVMYEFEHIAQPDVFKNAFSGIWWSTSTLLTVGYGDIYPVTVGGKVASIIITFLGVGMVAIPTGILSAGFTMLSSQQQTSQENSEELLVCPHCGKQLRDPGS